ncbi:hypothetical protein [Psychrobacillus lasiicapitis]|uniref:Uncharacterized protein n=1 Tax=Psychrobacillus lasiicapitis TaxID=1636719 RepID=A0A544TAJ3_9BACI|nr:hypothetical protein [Psychrobacillus lasiicapitis]TQR14484.1 hypothetical protein FG382_08490 [Psychrobacillus lasiicapitis]GGA30931.1 hypothetical protein GCM10011384_20550 [Psychrobacillus lasiicapitis]
MQTVEESTQNKLIEKMTDSVNALNVNFARVEGKIDSALELKKDVGLLSEKVDTIKTESSTTVNELKNAKEDIQILFNKSRERDKKADTDRKWLIGAIISVAGLGLTVLGLGVAAINLIIK